MKRIFVISLMALFVLAFAAMANEYEQTVDKELMLEAMDAYDNGRILTAEQRAILNLIDYETPAPADFSRRTGGPDGAGYTFTDSDEVGGPTFSWIDISDNTNLAADWPLFDDDHMGPFAIGFDFPFYGNAYSDLYIQSNGTINFQDSYISLSNQSIPTASYSAFIAWWWDDMDPDSGLEGEIYMETMMVGDQNACVISYHNYDEFNGGPDTPNVTAQVILFEDGTIKMQYLTFTGAFDYDGGTIGIQGDAGWAGLQYLYNGDFVGYPYPELAIEYVGNAPDASLSGYVYDSNMAPIGGADVMVGSSSTVTDGSGFYEFPTLYSGTADYEVSAPGYLSATGTIELVSGANTMDFTLGENTPQADILIWDGDETIDSGPEIQAILEGMGFSVYYTTTFDPLDWSAGYDAAFAITGIYPNDFAINDGSPEELAMIGYLDAGGNLYMEGGDQFGFSPPDALIAYFGVDASDGSADLTNVAGVAGTYTEGVDMLYAGENNYIDELMPVVGSAWTVLTNPADSEGTMVFNDGVEFKTAGASFELGMLTDGGDDMNTRAYLIEGIMDHFGMGGPQGPVTLDMIGVNVAIPPSGGTVTYDVHLVSTLNQTYTGVQYWTDVVLPNGNTYGPLYTQNFTLTPFMDVYVTGLGQNVPAMAPTGTYTFQGHVGYMSGPQVMDAFEFQKAGTLAAGEGNWDAVGEFEIAAEGEAEVVMPADYELHAVYPNPFNPTTNVRISLPEAAELTVGVFNVMGQQVAELASGQFSAGQHSFVLDGKSLSSGVYFIQANVPGELNAIQKVTLMK